MSDVPDRCAHACLLNLQWSVARARAVAEEGKPKH